MKKFFIIVAAFLLVFSLVCGALAEGEGVVFRTDYYTLELPEGWKVEGPDPENDLEKSKELGYFQGPADVDITVAAGASKHFNPERVAPYAGEQGAAAYTELILEFFKEKSVEYLGTVTVGDIPFILVKYAEDELTCLDVSAVVNNEEIEFIVYIADKDNFYSITDEAIEQFKTILETFKPVTE